ncbi:hypothetical protein D9611_005180 [Ephemerocybe angulata]|uniref:Uncharacterized protein n=1 Tax=Ephemerocybe angulata TaxID=980116 RepID=A0A8H5C1E0_9AGAR|nr:hypothetical protein D9611_005180 [Tulosesus angulatus]
MAAPTTAPSKTLRISTKPTEDSTQTPAPLPPLLYLKEDKDTLAFEHDRQKAKKTLDRARTKARKAFGGWGTPHRASSRDRDRESRTNGNAGQEARRVVAGLEDRELAGLLSSPAETRDVQQDGMPLPVGVRETPFTEVRLADLVLLAASAGEVPAVKGSGRRARGTKGGVGKGGLDGEFELVPHVRSVIVLDEQQFQGQVGWEDGWDVVESSESELSSDDGALGRGAKASYAKVAASGFKLDSAAK